MNLAEPKGRISIDTIMDVVHRVEGMDLAAKEKMCDELAASQPEALGCALVLPKLGVSMLVLDHVLHLVLVIAEAVRKTIGVPAPRIMLDMIDRAADKHAAMVRLLEGKTKAEFDRLVCLMAESQPERNLFAYVTGYLKEKFSSPSPEHERAIFAVAVVLDAFLQAMASADRDLLGQALKVTPPPRTSCCRGTPVGRLCRP